MINIISIILDLINYSFININSLFISLFSIESLIFIKNKKYLKAFILGIIFDLLFTNYYLLNGFIFLFLEYIIIKYYKYFKYNLINNIILSIILILIYNIILFIVLNVTKLNLNSFIEFLFIIKHFFIINIIYVLILSFIFKRSNIK